MTTPAIVALAPTDLAYPQTLPNRLTDDVLYIRDESRETSHDYVQVSIVIDAQGVVVDAQPTQGIERYFDAATALMQRQRYAPFTRGGKPTAAHFLVDVWVLPKERQPRERAAFPEGKPDTAVIRLRRGVCLGNCPIYEVSIDGNGDVTFDGQGYVAVERQLKYQVPAAEVAGLLERFRTAEFFSLDDRYQAGVTDMPSFKVSLDYGGMTKTVIDYMGLAVGMPVSVVGLEDEIDRVAGVERWLVLKPSTLAALKEVGVVPDSDELAAALACTADSLSDDELLALLSQGVPADGECPRPLGDPFTINVVARQGRTAMVHALLDHGALKNATAAKKSQLLCSAIVSDSPDLVRDVLQLQPDLEIPCSFSLSFPLTLAASSIRIGPSARDIFQLLADAGADPQHRDERGDMPIHRQINMAGVEALVALGADINARNGAGRTPLLEAGSEDFALALIEAGADTTGVDDQDRTLVERAKANNWPKVLEALERRAATPRSP